MAPHHTNQISATKTRKAYILVIRVLRHFDQYLLSVTFGDQKVQHHLLEKSNSTELDFNCKSKVVVQIYAEELTPIKIVTVKESNAQYSIYLAFLSMFFHITLPLDSLLN